MKLLSVRALRMHCSMWWYCVSAKLALDFDRLEVWSLITLSLGIWLCRSRFTSHRSEWISNWGPCQHLWIISKVSWLRLWGRVSCSPNCTVHSGPVKYEHRQVSVLANPSQDLPLQASTIVFYICLKIKDLLQTKLRNELLSATESVILLPIVYPWAHDGCLLPFYLDWCATLLSFLCVPEQSRLPTGSKFQYRSRLGSTQTVDRCRMFAV